MVERNPNLGKLQAGYLFPEINRRKRKLLEEQPGADVISLGIGNTTEPLTPHITSALKSAAKGLGTPEGYSGYGDEQGLTDLRMKIADVVYGGSVEAEEVFISDGAKSDIGRLQIMFGSGVSVAVQDPSYPVYVDGSVIAGATGEYDSAEKHFKGIQYLACTPDNGFFPELSVADGADVIYFCSPNNPTGAASTKEQLKELVDFASDNHAIILYDAAYSEFITEKGIPKSIFDVEGGRETALEIKSFSKRIGFTGVRLGWTVVPKELTFEGGYSVNTDWNRITSTLFNGASNIVQQGGLAALDDKGLAEMRETIRYYMGNARVIREGLGEIGVESYGGVNAPYIWAHYPGSDSWDVFTEILDKAHVVTTPGSGFGPAGECFIRYSAFGHREDVEEAVGRLKSKL